MPRLLAPITCTCFEVWSSSTLCISLHAESDCRVALFLLRAFKTLNHRGTSVSFCLLDRIPMVVTILTYHLQEVLLAIGQKRPSTLETVQAIRYVIKLFGVTTSKVSKARRPPVLYEMAETMMMMTMVIVFVVVQLKLSFFSLLNHQSELSSYPAPFWRAQRSWRNPIGAAVSTITYYRQI